MIPFTPPTTNNPPPSSVTPAASVTRVILVTTHAHNRCRDALLERVRASDVHEGVDQSPQRLHHFKNHPKRHRIARNPITEAEVEERDEVGSFEEGEQRGDDQEGLGEGFSA